MFYLEYELSSLAYTCFASSFDKFHDIQYSKILLSKHGTESQLDYVHSQLSTHYVLFCIDGHCLNTLNYHCMCILHADSIEQWKLDHVIHSLMYESTNSLRDFAVLRVDCTFIESMHPIEHSWDSDRFYIMYAVPLC